MIKYLTAILLLVTQLAYAQAYDPQRILNLDPNKDYSKDEILSSYKKIMKKIHPDVSPELTRIASLVNEAKDTVIKNLT